MMLDSPKSAERLRVLALPRYGRRGASSRLRLWQYSPWLQSAGLDVTARPLFLDSYIEELQAGRRDPVRMASAYVHQIARLLRREHFDLLWIEKEALPWLPGWIEQAVLPRDVPLVLDYDDAVYHMYETHRQSLVRAVLSSKHPAAMRRAALVIAGNATLAERAGQEGAKRVAIVPTVIDLDRYPAPVRRRPDNAPLLICWVGQRSTAAFLDPYRALFNSIAEAGHARFVAIGIDAAVLGLPMSSVPWTEDGEADAISSCDIGIMPLTDGPFERGKCGYKLIQYMACGLPVVASPVGANLEIVDHGVNGFLARTPEEWHIALSALASDAGLRARMGAAGRKRVEQTYSIQSTGPVLASLLRSAAAS